MTAFISKEELYKRLTEEADKAYERGFKTEKKLGAVAALRARGEYAAYTRAAAIVNEATEYQT